MKKLYIIRHAKSSWNFDLDDHDRPLGFRGRKDVKKVGRFLSQNIETPDLMISSSANRALSTALFLADEWGFPEEEIVLSQSLYHAEPNDIIDTLKEQNEDCIAIFGHNPGFTELANKFVPDYISNVPTTGCLGIAFDVDQWSEIDKSNAEQLFFHTPKSLKMTLR